MPPPKGEEDSQETVPPESQESQVFGRKLPKAPVQLLLDRWAKDRHELSQEAVTKTQESGPDPIEVTPSPIAAEAEAMPGGFEASSLPPAEETQRPRPVRYSSLAAFPLKEPKLGLNASTVALQQTPLFYTWCPLFSVPHAEWTVRVRDCLSQLCVLDAA